MRYMLGVIICAVFLISVNADASYGRVIYALTQNKQPKGPTDIYEKNLDTGKTDLLIPHSSLPKDFNSTVSSSSWLIVSPDGKYLLLGQPVQKKMTLSEAFGESITDGDQVVEIPLGDVCWLWDRSTEEFRRIIDEFDWYGMAWSPSDRYLLAFDYIESRFWIYDTVAGNLRKLAPLHNVETIAWSSAEDGIIAVTNPNSKSSVVYLQPLVPGTRKILFHWPGVIHSIAQSTDGSTYAFHDGEGVHLMDAKTKHVRKLRIPVKEELFRVSFSFNKDSSKLAVFTSHTFGEPHINWEDRLWLVDLEKETPVQLAHWDETYLGISPTAGSATKRELTGWTQDGKSILVTGQMIWGGEGATENRDDRFNLYAYDSTQPKDGGEEIFSSGPGCLGITWYSGLVPNP